MQDVHLRNLDLNLLRALDALLVERHVTRAARRVGLSQSAMSHALARLREQLGDPLLLRSSQGMQATERALALAGPLRAALAQLNQALAPTAPFEPAQARCTFRLGVSDYEGLVLVRALLPRLAREAPGVDLRLTTPNPPGVVPALLARGELDLVLKPFTRLEQGEGIYHQRLIADERFVVIARRGNPFTRPKLTLKRYVQAPHALVAPGGTPRGGVDDLLEQRGLSRRVMLTLPHFLLAPHLIAESDLLLTLAGRVAQRYVPLLGLEAHPLPVALASFSVHQIWHARTHADPAQRYLRKLLHDLASAGEV